MKVNLISFQDIVGLIRSYIEELHRTGRYDALADQVLQFKLSVQVFDPFGKALQENYFNDFTLMSETDLDRQVRNADARLGRYGFPNIYGSRYFDEENPNAHKIDCVLFAADESCRAKLGEYAKNKLREFSGKYRVAVANKSDACKRKYREIMADNLPKAKALAAYAKAEERIGRIQLIHKITGAGNKSRFVRLDLTDISVRDKVLRAVSNEELDHIFETDGSFE